MSSTVYHLVQQLYSLNFGKEVHDFVILLTTTGRFPRRNRMQGFYCSFSISPILKQYCTVHNIAWIVIHLDTLAAI
jgi:uncharacterized membrane protein